MSGKMSTKDLICQTSVYLCSAEHKPERRVALYLYASTLVVSSSQYHVDSMAIWQANQSLTRTTSSSSSQPEEDLHVWQEPPRKVTGDHCLNLLLSGVAPKYEREVTLKKVSDSLGIVLKPGEPEHAPYVITKLQPGKTASDSGLLFPGDGILKVNGTSLVGKTQEDVVKLLKSSKREVVLIVKYDHQVAQKLQKTQMNVTVASTESSVLYGSESTFDDKEKSLFEDSKKDSKNDVIEVNLEYAFVTRHDEQRHTIRLRELTVLSDLTSTKLVFQFKTADEAEYWHSLVYEQIHKVCSSPTKSVDCVWLDSEKLLPNGKPLFQRHILQYNDSEISLFKESWTGRHQTRDLVWSQPLKYVLVRPGTSSNPDLWASLVIKSSGCIDRYLYIEGQKLLDKVISRIRKQITNMVVFTKTETFQGSMQGELVELTFCLDSGISLRRLGASELPQTFRFSMLKGSSDDGIRNLTLAFQGFTFTIDLPDLMTVVYCLHAFISTCLALNDPLYFERPLLSSSSSS